VVNMCVVEQQGASRLCTEMYTEIYAILHTIGLLHYLCKSTKNRTSKITVSFLNCILNRKVNNYYQITDSLSILRELGGGGGALYMWHRPTRPHYQTLQCN
jgi:hypothetical protein